MQPLNCLVLRNEYHASLFGLDLGFDIAEHGLKTRKHIHMRVSYEKITDVTKYLQQGETMSLCEFFRNDFIGKYSHSHGSILSK